MRSERKEREQGGKKRAGVGRGLWSTQTSFTMMTSFQTLGARRGKRRRSALTRWTVTHTHEHTFAHSKSGGVPHWPFLMKKGEKGPKSFNLALGRPLLRDGLLPAILRLNLCLLPGEGRGLGQSEGKHAGSLAGVDFFAERLFGVCC